MIQLGGILMCKLLKYFVFLVVYFLRFTPSSIPEIVAALDEVLLFLFKLLFPSVFKTQSLST
jgi:hypothetical protein